MALIPEKTVNMRLVVRCLNPMRRGQSHVPTSRHHVDRPHKLLLRYLMDEAPAIQSRSFTHHLNAAKRHLFQLPTTNYQLPRSG